MNLVEKLEKNIFSKSFGVAISPLVALPTFIRKAREGSLLDKTYRNSLLEDVAWGGGT